jgi:hypothetical protein
MDILKKKDKPVSEAKLARFAACHHRVNNCILCKIIVDFQPAS